MISIKREKWAECIDEIMPMCQQVFDLKEAKFTGLSLAFDHDLYLESEDAGYFHCIVMRISTKPIGFHWIVISPMERHKGKFHAHTDAIFVDPIHRNLSRELIQFSEQYIKERADFWTLANLDEKSVEDMWKRNGFQCIEKIMFKKL